MSILFIFTISLFYNCFSTDKSKSEVELSNSSIVYYDVAGKQEYRMVTYKITNLSADKYAYTWIFYEEPFAKKSRNAKNRYLLQHYGEFGLLNLLTDNAVGEIYHELGTFFIKEINPGESFEYIVIAPSKIPQKLIDNKIKPFIYYVLEYDSLYGDYLRHPMNEFVFFPDSKIVIPFHIK